MRKPARTYEVAIPTYARADLLERTTLHLLASRGVAPERITLFVDATDPDFGAYQDLAHTKGLAGVHTCRSRGINAARRAIADYYPHGTPVVQCDDDITDVLRATGPKSLVPVTELHTWLQLAFTTTAGADLYCWGVNPVVNPYFMAPRQGGPSTGLKFLIGTFWGFFSRPGHPVHATTVEVKEDYDTSLRAWWYDGGALRFDTVSVKADHYRAAGGCQDYRTLAASATATDKLLRTWPGLVRRNTRRAGHDEVLLVPKRRHRGHPTHVPPPGLAQQHVPAP